MSGASPSAVDGSERSPSSTDIEDSEEESAHKTADPGKNCLRDLAYEALGRKSCRIIGSRAHRLTRACGGSITYHSVSASLNLREGPQCIADFARWPEKVAADCFSDSIAGNARRRRYEVMMANGHVLHSDFSGQGCVEQSYVMMEKALTSMGVALPNGGTAVWRVTDTDALCQKVLRCQHANHIFARVEDRVPEPHKTKMEALRPKVDDKTGRPLNPEEAKQQYGKMRTYLASNGNDMFNTECMTTMSQCLVHKKLCPTQAPVDNTLPAELQPLRSVIAGTMCTPWTSLGSMSGPAHPANESHIIWAEHARQEAADIVSLENSEFFPVDDYRKTMMPNHQVVNIVVCPTMLGWPVRRVRLLASAINLKRMVWVGPTEEQAVSDDFLNTFGSHVEVEADAFSFIDEVSNRTAFLKSLAASRGIFGDFMVKDILPPDAFRRLQSGLESYRHHIGLGGSCAVDLSQNPRKRKRMGPWFPSFARSTMSASYTALSEDDNMFPYLFTPREIAQVHGWPALKKIAGEAAPFHDLMPSIFDELTPSQYGNLIGNGMHLHVMGAWLTYVKSQCVPRFLLESWSPTREWVLAVAAAPSKCQKIGSSQSK